MKQILLRLFVLFIVSSGCKKDSQPKLPNSEFSFMADGKAYAFNGSLYADKGSRIEKSLFTPEYYVVGKASFDTWLEAKFPETQIKIGTYSVNFTMSVNGIRYDYSKNGILTISTVDNNLASGTFSGEVSQSSGSAPMVISNGRFKDVLVR